MKKSDENISQPVADEIPDPNRWLSDFRDELNRIKGDRVAKPAQKARFTEEQFLNPKTPASLALRAKIDKLKLPWGTVELILSDNADVRRQAIAELMDGGGLAELDSVADTLRDLFDNRASSGLTIAHPDHTDATTGADAARLCLDHYYQNFLIYDLITYPVQYGTNSGEANVVHVYRETWRKNDMLWGRLDGAERLISVLLPDDTPERKNLMNRAHRGILSEEILQGNGDAVCQLLSNARAHPHQKSIDDEHAKKLVETTLNDPALEPYMTQERRSYLVAPRKFDRQLDAETALRYISRSTNITGSMLEGLADQHRFDSGKRAASWVTRFGATFWNMIAVAVPQSLGSIFFRHWLGLLYLFAFALIAVGIFVSNNVKFAGWQVLGIAVVIHVVVSGIESYVRGGRFLRLAKTVATFAVLALMVFGVLTIIERFGNVSLSWPSELAVAGVIALCGSLLLRRRNSPR